MKIILEPSNDWVTIDNVPCRMWDGTTESGIKIQAAIARFSSIDETPGKEDQFKDECIKARLRSPQHTINMKQIIKDM